MKTFFAQALRALQFGYLLLLCTGMPYCLAVLPFQLLTPEWYQTHLTYRSGHPLFWVGLLYIMVGTQVMLAYAWRSRLDTSSVFMRGFYVPLIAQLAVILPKGRRWLRREFPLPVKPVSP